MSCRSPRAVAHVWLRSSHVEGESSVRDDVRATTAGTACRIVMGSTLTRQTGREPSETMDIRSAPLACIGEVATDSSLIDDQAGPRQLA